MGCGLSKYSIVIDTADDVRRSQQVPLPRNGFSNGDFELSVCVGKGKFGVVFLGKHKATNTFYALKYIAKNIIEETQGLDRIQQELNTLQRLNHPFIIKYFGGFKTDGALVVITDFAVGGELYSRMKQDFRMSESTAMFYAAEIASALHYLHDTMQIVYRDLKPENCLIDSAGHIKLCDMGFAESGHTQDANKGFLSDHCGTAMYVAPEICNANTSTTHGFPVDWWSYGCVLYEMVTGIAPFGDSEKMNKFEIFTNINSGKVSYPLGMNSKLVNLIKMLLEIDPAKRASWRQVMTHEWFSSLSWEALDQKCIIPPWIPDLPPGTTPAGKALGRHFVDWKGLIVPGVATKSAMLYCNSLKLPSPGKHVFAHSQATTDTLTGKSTSRNRGGSKADIRGGADNVKAKRRKSSA